MDSNNNRQNVVQIMSEDIVISGMSGRFPESESTDEFAKNLYNKVDMITTDDRRWPTDLYGMAPHMGKLKEVDKFDPLFFGIMHKMADSIDPHSRILLETAYESIIDAGVSPQSLRGTDTGVYIGYSTFGMPDGLPEEVQPDSQASMTDTLLWIQGTNKCLYANRLSFVLDLKGPSLVLDTACSSSMVALNLAINDIRLGICDQAIVGGTNINLQPFTNHIFQSTRLNSDDGIPKVWDETADGFSRGETVACLFLQRKSSAKRIYATILSSGVNIDGNKRMGMFYPSADTQEELMIKTYKKANVDPLKVNYFEAHATGTRAGDPQEAKAIYNAYCVKPKREGTLPIGLLKSNIGHGEAASGVGSIVKVLLAFENECIPPSLHLKKIKSTIKDMSPPLIPITENFAYKPGIAGVNNFGVGGVNAHALLEPNYKTESEDNDKIADIIPRIINIGGRTEEAFNEMCNWIENNPEKVTRDFLALLTDTMKREPQLNSASFPFRGSLFIKEVKDGTNGNKYEYKRQHSVFSEKSVRPLWFLFPGLGGQWVGMARALMPIKIFADKIEECHRILKPYNIDLNHLLLSEDKQTMSTMTNKFCATTAIEIALFDVLAALDIVPDGIIGHSFGEIACAYADGCLTTEEALLVSLKRGIVTESDKRIPKGLMAAVGMSWNKMKKLLPNGVHVVCNNAKDIVVISGLFDETKTFINSLKDKGIFVRELDSHDIPYHSEFLISSAQRMTDEIKEVLPKPKLRSKKWVSTAVLESDPKEELLYASAEYFVHNLISPVYFYNKLQQLPANANVVEIGPHALFAKIITQTLEASTYISLIKKDSNDTNLDQFLSSISRLYELGLNPSIENLYPKVQFPVKRKTQSLASLMKWDHQVSHFVRKYPDFYFHATASDLNETIDISKVIKSFYPDHKIDGNIIFPATGYLMLAWRQLAAYKGRIWNQIPVIFEDVQFRSPVFLSDSEITKLKVVYHPKTNDFVIYEHNNETCVGKVRTSDEDVLTVQDLMYDLKPVTESEIVIERNDIYKDLRVMGYDYGPKFRRLKKIASNDFKTMTGEIEWDGNWVTFMDSLLQAMALAMPFKKMMVPVMIKRLRCDPRVFYEWTKKFEIEIEKEYLDQEKGIHDVEEASGREDELGDMLESSNTELLYQLISNRFHIYNSVMPFFVDVNSRMVVTHGIEVEDMLAIPISRKTNIQDLKMESYQFIANEDFDAIEDRLKIELAEYLKVCTTMAMAIKDLVDSNGHKFIEDNNNEIIKITTSEAKDDQILLKLLIQLYKGFRDENQNVVECRKFVTELQKKAEYDISGDVINQVSKNELLVRSLLDIVSEAYIPKKILSVLEINLTNSLLAKEVDSYLASSHIYPIDVNYTIVVKSIDSVPQDLKSESFKFNEWNPNESLFPNDVTPKDLIILRDCQELWHLNVESLLQEISDSVIYEGFFMAVFRYQFTEPELSLNQMNGKKNLKNSDLEQRIVDFMKSVESVGLTLIGRKCDSVGSLSLLFRKVLVESQMPKKDNIVIVGTKSEDWFETLRERIVDIKDNDKTDEKIWIIVNDSDINGIIGLVNCLRLEPGGDVIRCLFDCDRMTKTPIDFHRKPFSDILRNNLPINVFKNGKLGTYRHLSLPKDYDKTESNDYYLNVGANRDLSSLQWFDARQLVSPKESFDLNNNQINKVRVNIYSSGLNFRDVMFATGRIASGPLALLTDCLIGFEFAGRRCDTGERVMGFDMSRCFATFIDAVDGFITPIPDHWSMDEAATILSTYSTVWYGLIGRANIKENETILIHSGAGGVGQAAIRVCQHYKCDIFVTVGNEDKKKFLMTEYNIPENRIFSSRDIHFKYKIKSLTNGRGVDLVLNSLTGDKLEASYECVADCGRFVEIGKYDLQMNKQLGMFSFLRDISFIGVSADRKLFMDQSSMKSFFDWMHKNSSNGMIKPINQIIFKAEDAEKAFRYMTTGKHIGKIIIKMRDEESVRNPIACPKPALTLKATAKTYFDPNKVYIISGGLGGMGLELINWMLSVGARKFVLTSRFGVRFDYQKFVLKRLELFGERYKYFGTKAVVSTHNCQTIDGTKQMLEESAKLGPIGGVFHLALVLHDAFLENQTKEEFFETIYSKTKAFENLDKISRDLKLNLDYFVVFSSVSCGKGNAGQTNYGFGNSVCERICENRLKNGLHGLAVQWGPVGDVGVMTEMEVSSLAGVVKQRINSCLEVFDKILQSNYHTVLCILRAKRVIQSGTREARIVQQVWQALGIDPKTTPDYLTLGEIGMESMFAAELQQGLERDYNIKLTLNDIKNVTIKHLKDFESGKIEEIRKYTDCVNESREKLSKIKFIVPTETHSRLNHVKTGKPIFFLPPLEGIFYSVEELAQKVDRPVIGLNWTKEMEKFVTLKEICNYFKDLMHILEPDSKHDILGQSYSALTAIKLLRKAPVGRAVIIDSLSDIKVEEELLNDDYLLDLILSIVWKDLPDVFRDKLIREVKQISDVNQKIVKISNEVKEFVGKSFVSKDLEEILRNSFFRAKMFTYYRIHLRKKFKQMKIRVGQKYMEMSGKLYVIKPFKTTSEYDLEDAIERIKDSYFLPENGLEGHLTFDHINENTGAGELNKIAAKLNEYFVKK